MKTDILKAGRRYFPLLLFVGFSFFIPAGIATGQSAGAIIVKAGVFRSDIGPVMIGLYKDPKKFKLKTGPYAVGIADIIDGRIELAFEEIPYGVYALKFYHDRNENSRIDDNIFGFPTEQFGFSNNACATWGHPGFDKAKFTLDRAELVLEIKVQG
ncbi:hypothetical protein MNBD_NITROSPINAE02-1883 [hydrothermal vent metagenome]|uniref:DUF2141 domain-containing protein n=1 Tax=hydrothermal vent metagenome TaxID=652676 RepID=A0A3B1CFD3_9ZZZZ